MGFEIPKGYYGRITTRSSVRAKGVLIEGTIDADYRGDIYIIATNTATQEAFYKKDGNAIAQVIWEKYEQATFTEVEELTPTDRKGGFGSTNVKAITSHPGKLTFKCNIKGKEMDALLDSGADGTAYGPKDLPKKHNLKVTKLNIPIDITTAGNGKHSITTVAKDVLYSIQGFSGKMDILIMPVHMDQLVLGNHWLSAINPQIDWKEKELTITQGDVIHTL